MQKLINQHVLFFAMKRGLVLALVGAALVLVVAISIWYALQPKISDVAREECKGDDADFKKCVAREQKLDECEKDTANFRECAAQISYGELEKPNVTIKYSAPIPPS